MLVVTLRRRIVLALGSLAAVSLALCLVLLLVVLGIAAAFDDVRHDERASRDGLMLGVAVREQYMHEAHTLIESTRSHLPHHHTWVEQVAQGARDLEARVPEAERWRVARIAAASREIDELFQRSLMPAMERGDAETLAREHRRVDELVTRASRDADAVLRALEIRMAHAHARAEQATQRALIVASLGTILVSLLAIAHALALRRHGLRPLARIVGATEAIARGEVPASRGEGDAEVRAVEDALSSLSAALRERETRLLAAERMAVLGQLAAGVAHEVNNPIGVIRGYLRTMIPDAKDDEQRGELLILDEEAAACQRIAEDLLAYARSGELRRSEVEIDSLVAETTRRLEVSGALGDRSVHQDVCGATLRVDAGRLRQVVENLLRNAAEASVPSGAISIVGRTAGPLYRLEIADSGHGVPKEARERVFEPFFTTRPAGSGLGLAVCLGVVRAHGGSIAVDDAPGGGAVFRVELPLDDAAAAGAVA